MYKSILSVVFLGLAFSACTNPEVQAGHEGYVYYKPLIFGQMEYRETLRGPATTGVSWRLYVESVDMRARSYKEDFQLLTQDNLSVSFEVNTRISLRPGSAKEVVEDWGGDKWYEWNVKERMRTIVREQVTQFKAMTIQLETPKVRAQIEQKLREQYENAEAPTPIVIESVDIGQIKFPDEVAEAIQRKIATKQELERQQYVLDKTEEEAAIKVLEAIKVAKQQLIISSTLDPLYVQQRAVQVYRKVAESDNDTVIMLPNTADGTALPLILEPKQRRVLSTSDKKRLGKFLDDLEANYAQKAAVQTKEATEAEPGDAGGEAEEAAPEAPAQGGEAGAEEGSSAKTPSASEQKPAGSESSANPEDDEKRTTPSP